MRNCVDRPLKVRCGAGSRIGTHDGQPFDDLSKGCSQPRPVTLTEITCDQSVKPNFVAAKHSQVALTLRADFASSRTEGATLALGRKILWWWFAADIESKVVQRGKTARHSAEFILEFFVGQAKSVGRIAAKNEI